MSAGNIWSDFHGEDVDGSPRPTLPGDFPELPAPARPADIDALAGDELTREMVRELRRLRKMLEERLP